MILAQTLEIVEFVSSAEMRWFDVVNVGGNCSAHHAAVIIASQYQLSESFPASR